MVRRNSYINCIRARARSVRICIKKKGGLQRAFVMYFLPKTRLKNRVVLDVLWKVAKKRKKSKKGVDKKRRL